MKLVAAGLLLASAMSVQAFSQGECNVHVDGELNINKSVIAFGQTGKSFYEIKNGHELWMNGAEISLNKQQSALVASYDQKLRAMVPEVKAIAEAGIDLAIETVALTFDGLLGEDNDVTNKLVTELTGLRGDLHQYFSVTDDIHLNSNKIGSEPDFMGNYFSDRVERIVETAIEESKGAIMMEVAKEMLLGDGNMDKFGQRMGMFGKQLEQQVNIKSTALVDRGEHLCEAVKSLDAIEQQLQLSLPAAKEFDLVRVGAAGHSI